MESSEKKKHGNNLPPRTLGINDRYWGDEKNRKYRPIREFNAKGELVEFATKEDEAKIREHELQEYATLQRDRNSDQQEMSWRNKWRFWNLEVVEQIYFSLRDNPVHPFTDLGSGFYMLLLRKDRYHFGVGLIFVTLLAFINFSIFIGVFTMTVLTFTMCMGTGLYFLYGNTTQKELIISRSAGYVVRTRGKKKVFVEEPINNVYLKLVRRTDSNQRFNYFICLGGYKLDDIRLTPFTMDLVPLRLMAKAIAHRMGLNYFDFMLNSPLHTIFHYPGYFSTIRARDEDFEKFLKSHNLTRKVVQKAQAAEGLPQKTTKVPKALLQKILIDEGQHPDLADVRGRPLPPEENWGEIKTRLWDPQKRFVETAARPTLSSTLAINYAAKKKHHERFKQIEHRFDWVDEEQETRQREADAKKKDEGGD